MFYVPYKFKSQDAPCTPRGPSFFKAPTVKTQINGTNLSLKLPRHKTIMNVGYVSPPRKIDYRVVKFSSIDHKKSGLKTYKFVSRIWDFNGPSFTGSMGDLSIVGVLMYLPTQPAGTSFFHPAFFENTISDYLQSFYCDHADRFEPDEPYVWKYQAPVDWRVLEFDYNLHGVRFDIVKRTDISTGAKHTYLFVPISDNYILKFSLQIDRNINFNKEISIDEWINPQPFIELREQIIGSIKVELSEDAKKQRELALQGVANPKLSETFAPIDWPKDGILKEKFDIENDDGWGEYS